MRVHKKTEKGSVHVGSRSQWISEPSSISMVSWLNWVFPVSLILMDLDLQEEDRPVEVRN